MNTPLESGQAATAHTPGPWFARMQQSARGEPLGWIIEHKNGRIGWSSLAYAGTNKGVSHDDPVCAANARLMAAAPDLLKACEQALYALKGREHDGFLRAAIAKATGSQP